MSIAGLSMTIPQTAAPFVASLLLDAGGSSTADNKYSLLYLTAAVLAVIDDLIIMRVRSRGDPT